MKLLHLSDLHIGKIVQGFSMLDDQRALLSHIIEMVNTHGIDAILIAGDIYDKSSPSAEATSLFDWLLVELAATGAKIFAIPGNHDSPERISYASRLLESQGVYFPPVFDGKVHHHSCSDEYGEIIFWLLPFLKPVMVRPFFPEANIERDYTAALQAVLDKANPDTSIRNVILSHQFVTSPGSETERSDSELSLGGIDNVDAKVYEDFDYVALGHIHHPQRVGRDTLRYSGSPLKYSFSEIRYPKSAPLITLREKGDIDITLLPLHPARDMREIKGPLDALISPEVYREGCANDYVRVILTDEQEPLDAMAKIRAVYPHAMSLEFDNRRTQSTTDIPSPELLKEKSSFELFSEFYESQNGSPLSSDQAQLVRQALRDAEGQGQ